MAYALDHAKKVVAKLGINHKEFAQADIITSFAPEHQQGVCFGLTLMYMAYHNGIFDTTFFEALTAETFRTPSVVNYISLAQNWQKKQGYNEDERDRAKQQIMSMFGFKFVDSRKFDDNEPNYNRFVDYVGKAGMFSLISIPGHAMGAVGKYVGLKFFDPNCGEVTTKTHATMAKFLELYFSERKMKGFYLRNSRFNPISLGERATMEVSRFKLHG